MSCDNEDHLINPARFVPRQQNPLSVTQSTEVEEFLPNHSSFPKEIRFLQSLGQGQAIWDHEHVNYDEELECEVMSEQP
ncbi:hypothetical protein J6590_069231 [Homalodisca vitripennis]|nr:hypothetical protein J6590_069231 [Homalodisca vitripennis]